MPRTWAQLTVFRKDPDASIFKTENPVSPKRQNPCRKLHGVTTQKIAVFRKLFSAFGEFILWIQRDLKTAETSEEFS
jgi:hypothetical protein